MSDGGRIGKARQADRDQAQVNTELVRVHAKTKKIYSD